jgi:hypothetical protein
MSHSVSSAVAACRQACSQESSALAYEALLWAVGNNHAGTYNSSALLLTDSLEPILCSSGSWSQRAALEAMIDLYASFEPEPGAKSEQGSYLVVELRRRVAILEPLVMSISQSGSVASSSAIELLELLHARAA